VSHSTLGAPIEAYAPQKADVETLDAVVLLRVLSEVKGGDFTARMPIHWTGVAGKVADQLNDIIGANQALGTGRSSTSLTTWAWRSSPRGSRTKRR